MLELSILGFLADSPLHGYELRRKIEALSGYARPVSDGSLYPAIDRLARLGLLQRRSERGRAARRQVLELTPSGEAELEARLRSPAEIEITDLTRWLVVLAFLHRLPAASEREAVLRRRLDFLDQPASFFYDGNTPLRRRDVGDPYREGIFVIARATSSAEKRWLRQQLSVITAAASPSDLITSRGAR